MQSVKWLRWSTTSIWTKTQHKLVWCANDNSAHRNGPRFQRRLSAPRLNTLYYRLTPWAETKGLQLLLRALLCFWPLNQTSAILLHGDRRTLDPLVARKGLSDRIDVRHAEDVVSMSDKPSQVMRHGKKTSMWSAVEAVRSGDASVCVSCGNTGALMAVSMIRLRKVDGVNRPAIACLWPSRNPGGFNVMLDVGADIRADQDDLLTYALMGGILCPQRFGSETSTHRPVERRHRRTQRPRRTESRP